MAQTTFASGDRKFYPTKQQKEGQIILYGRPGPPILLPGRLVSAQQQSCRQIENRFGKNSISTKNSALQQEFFFAALRTDESAPACGEEDNPPDC